MPQLIIPTRDVVKELKPFIATLVQCEIDPTDVLSSACEALVSYDAHEPPTGSDWLSVAYEALEEHFLAEDTNPGGKTLDELDLGACEPENIAIAYAQVAGELYHALLPYKDTIIPAGDNSGFVSGLQARGWVGNDAVIAVEYTKMRP